MSEGGFIMTLAERKRLIEKAKQADLYEAALTAIVKYPRDPGLPIPPEVDAIKDIAIEVLTATGVIADTGWYGPPDPDGRLR